MHIMVLEGMKMKEGLVTGKLVEEYYIGNTLIQFYDGAYINKTQEDIDKILKRIVEIALRSMR